MPAADSLYNELLTVQSVLQNKIKNELDEKASRKYEKDLSMISSLLLLLPKYMAYTNRLN